jgi:hypothetical protein
MAFTKEPTKTPASIGEIRIELVDTPAGPLPENVASQGANYRVVIVFSDGSTEVRSGNLVPHLTAGQINSLVSFMNTMRTKAVSEFIG